MAETEGGFWAGDGEALARGLAAEYGLSAESAAVLRHAAGHIDRFYGERKSLNHRGTYIPVTQSPIPRESGRALLRIAIQERVQNTLEVGLAFGMSTCHLLMAHEVTQGNEHVAIDPFQHTSFYQGTGLINAMQSGLSQRLLWLKELSSQALPRLLADKRSFDLCFVDGSHIFGDAFVDAYYCHQMLRPSGLLILDDALLPAIRTLRNILVTNFGFTHEEIPSLPNQAFLRKTGEGLLDWKDFQHQWQPFDVG